MRTHVLAIGLLYAVTAAAVADNQVSVWSATLGDYQVLQSPPSVEIYGPGTYKIEVTDEGAPDGLGRIELISVTQAVSGAVIIHVERSVGVDQPGAADVWEINLDNATAGHVAELRITGNYGHAEQGGTLIADSAGALNIGGDVVKPVEIQRNGALRRV